jgi:predicted PhzF superfamily epimerase YddE/YHI9
LTPYWASILGKTELTARQLSQRTGDLTCNLMGDRVEIAGEAVLYLKGEIEV